MGIERLGYGQVEPNHLSAQRNGKIYAQLPAASDLKLLENGMFVKYDYAAGEVNLTGEGEWLLVLNEVKVYDDRETYKDFAMRAEDAVGGVITPRLFKTDIGDIYTTNCFEKPGSKGAVTATTVDYPVGTYCSVDTNGYLKKVSDASGEFVWKVVKAYTMPDGQAGVKLQRIK